MIKNAYSGLPDSALVDKVLPKTKIYEKAKVKHSTQKEFSKKIKKILVKYTLSERTINTPRTDKIVEILIFDIELKEFDIPKKILKIIDRAIPYQILYRFIYKDSTCWGIALKHETKIENYFFSSWNELIQFNFDGGNLETVYQNLVKAFIRNEAKTSEDFREVISKNNALKKLEKEIQVLKNKIQNTKTLSKKISTNKILLARQSEIEKLKSAQN